MSRLHRYTLALALALSMPAATERTAGSAELAPDRPCVVFCVGVERYNDDNADLNRLRHVGEDAFAVWNRLKAIARVDVSRSRLLVADREATGPLPTDPNENLTRLELRTINEEFGKFRARIHDGDLVVIYLGGHGVVGKNPTTVGVSFCASDFNDVAGIYSNRVLLNAMFLELKEAMEARPKAEFVVLGNMCHAGAARPNQGGEAVQQGDVKKAASIDQKVIEGQRVAYIPACSGTLTTFEDKDLGRSIYAYHLLQALEGGGAKGSVRDVTTGGVLDFLQKSLKAPPPELSGFDRDIRIGTLLEREASFRRLAAIGLLSAATDRTDEFRSTLFDLAERQFALCTQMTTDARLENLCSQLQCDWLLERDASRVVKAVIDEARDIKEPRTEAERRAVGLKDILTGKPRSADPFVLLVHGRILDFGDFPSNDFVRDLQRRWYEAFTAKPGYLSGKIIPEIVDDGGLGQDFVTSARNNPSPAKIRDAINELKKTTRVQTGGSPDLVFVYCGTAVAPPTEGGTSMGYPFTSSELYEALASWPGRIVLFWAMNGARALQPIPPALKQRASLMLLTTDHSSFSSLKGIDRAVAEVKRGLDDGSFARVAKMTEEEKQERKPFSTRGESAPNPKWVGDYRPSYFWMDTTSRRVRSALAEIGLPAPWWSATFATSPAAGWLGRRLTNAALAEAPPDPAGPVELPLRRRIKELERRDPADPFVGLELGAVREAVRDYPLAAARYEEFAKAVRTTVGAAPTTTSPDLDGLRARGRKRLLELADRIEGRVRERLKIGPMTVRLVTAAVDDYRSPLIGDLDGCRADVLAWLETLKKKAVPVVPYPAQPATADGIRTALAKALADTKDSPQDLILFVFSGRGIQTEGNRYLVTEEARPAPEFGDDNTEIQSPPAFSDGSPLVISPLFPQLTVSEVARTIADAKRSAIAIYDCQFSTPQPGEVGPLDKHLDSVRQLRPEPGASGTRSAGLFPELLSTPASGAQRGTRLAGPSSAMVYQVVTSPRRADNDAPGWEVVRNQVHLWWSGRLTQPIVGAGPAKAPLLASLAGSPLSRGLLMALEQTTEGTYADWLERAGTVIRAPRTGLYMIQGAVDRPLFAAGSDDRVLQLLLSDHFRRLANLELAIDATESADALLTRPADKLVRAALWYYRAELHREGQRDDSADGAGAALAKCRDFLRDVLRNDAPAVVEERLVDLVVQLVERAFEPDPAREALLDLLDRTGTAALTPELERRLVELTGAATVQGASARVRDTLTRLRKLAMPASRRTALETQFGGLLKVSEGPLDRRPVVPRP